jgi:hypothetical protein
MDKSAGILHHGAGKGVARDIMGQADKGIYLHP